MIKKATKWEGRGLGETHGPEVLTSQGRRPETEKRDVRIYTVQPLGIHGRVTGAVSNHVLHSYPRKYILLHCSAPRERGRPLDVGQ